MGTPNNRNQLRDEELNKIHSESLGLNVPENYFSKSKIEILTKTVSLKETKVIPFYKKRKIWFAAATIAMLMGLTFWKNNTNLDKAPLSIQLSDSLSQIGNQNTIKSVSDSNYNYNNLIPNTNIAAENDFLVGSLFVDDKEIDEYITRYILEDI